MSARLHMLGCDGAHARRSDNQTSRKKLCGFARKSVLAIDAGLRSQMGTSFSRRWHRRSASPAIRRGTKCFLDARTWASENATRACILTNFGRAQMPDRID
jgi:hypothetical protein